MIPLPVGQLGPWSYIINVPTVGQPAGTVVPFEHNAAHITLPAYTHRQINEGYGSTPHLQAGSE